MLKILPVIFSKFCKFLANSNSLLFSHFRIIVFFFLTESAAGHQGKPVSEDKNVNNYFQFYIACLLGKHSVMHAFISMI